MRWTRIGLTVAGAAALLAVPLAASTVWLLLTSPATVAGAVGDGDVVLLARELAAVLVAAVRGLLTYL